MTLRIRLLLVLFAVTIAVAGYWYWTRTTVAAPPPFRTVAIERGDLVAAVSSAGTLAAVTTVQVGSQISGQIRQLMADFNSPVTAGQVIARIDPDTFQSRVAQAQANLEVARAALTMQQAALTRAQADVQQAEANTNAARANTRRAEAALQDSRRDSDRKAALAARGVLSEAERDRTATTLAQNQASLSATQAQERSSQAAIASGAAALRMADAQVANAQAVIRQREAELRQAEIDLERTFIRAPVAGTVIQRNVDLGQTVAASLQAPVLFTIAADLTSMQVETSVDEADVGRVREGQRATFTVDAFPGRTFEGQVRQVRLASTVVQNVVTYTVVVSAPNPDSRLLPGMTANVRIVTDERRGVLRAPNAALRFRPPPGVDVRSAAMPAGTGEAQPMPTAGPQLREYLVRELALDAGQQAQLDAMLAESRRRFAAVMAETPEGERRQAFERLRQEGSDRIAALLRPEQRRKYDALRAARREGGLPGRLHVVEPDGALRLVNVRLGATDGAFTEIIGGDLAEGARLALPGTTSATPAPTGAAGPPRLRF